MKSEDKKMEIWRKKSIDELLVERMLLIKAKFGLLIRHKTRQLSKTSEIKQARRDIARINTLLTEKAL